MTIVPGWNAASDHEAKDIASSFSRSRTLREDEEGWLHRSVRFYALLWSNQDTHIECSYAFYGDKLANERRAVRTNALRFTHHW